jgi:general secretion pathway protein G
MRKFFKKIRENFNDGFSLTEVIVWVTLAAVFSSLIAIGSVKLINNAKVHAAKQEMNIYSAALLEYYQDKGNFPDENDGLSILLKENYINKKGTTLKDPWKNDYIYTLTNNGEDFVIKSLGSDKKEGGNGSQKDIVVSSSNADSDETEVIDENN